MEYDHAIHHPNAGHLYWADFSDGGTITEAGLDGTGVTALVSGQSDAAGVAVDGSHLYWADQRAGTIMEAGLDGSNPTTLVTGQNYTYGVAVGSS